MSPPTRYFGALLLLATYATASVQGAAPRTIVLPEVGDPNSAGQVLVAGDWGDAPGEFGTTDDTSRPGPMDFALHEKALYVLDSVNGRTQVFNLDGSLREVLPIGTRTADFMCVDTDGSVAVLDAFVKRELKVFAPKGELNTTARLPDTLRLPSAVFARQGEYRVEDRHDRVYVLRTNPGRTNQPARVKRLERGRPNAANGDTMHARKTGVSTVVLESAAENEDPTATEVIYPTRIRSIVALEADRRGNTYLAAVCQNPDAPDEARGVIYVCSIDTAGELAGVLTLPDQYVTDHFRKLLVTPAGEIIQMQTTEAGVQFIRWRMQAPLTEGN